MAISDLWGTVPTGVETKEAVSLTGAGLISLDDHKLRAEVVAETLTALGYNEFATFFNPKTNVIEVELLLPEGTTHPTKSDAHSNGAPAISELESELQGRAAKTRRRRMLN